MSTSPRIEQAAEIVQRRLRQVPAAAIIVGSGLGEWTGRIEDPVAIPFTAIPGFAPATAAGHRGELIGGVLEDRPIVVMAGRFHRYEGHTAADVMFPVRLLARLGAERLIVTNAAGGLNPNFKIGDLVILTDHIDRMPAVNSISGPATPQVLVPMSRSPLPGTPPLLGSLPTRHRSVYDRQLGQLAIQAGLDGGFIVHRGIYLATVGPNYETRAEIRMMRRWGADLVGMSTVPEVLAGIDAGMRVLALSMVSNLANPDRRRPANHQEVLQAGRSAAVKIERVIRGVLRD